MMLNSSVNFKFYDEFQATILEDFCQDSINTRGLAIQKFVCGFLYFIISDCLSKPHACVSLWKAGDGCFVDGGVVQNIVKVFCPAFQDFVLVGKEYTAVSTEHGR